MGSSAHGAAFLIKGRILPKSYECVMPNISILPFLFILLWSSAFISGKAIMADATPFAALLFRFCVVTFGFGVVCLIVRQTFQLSVRKIMDAIFIGVLFHGIYLGGVF